MRPDSGKHIADGKGVHREVESEGTARIALSWVMTTTVTNKILAIKGLVSPDSYYLKQKHVI